MNAQVRIKQLLQVMNVPSTALSVSLGLSKDTIASIERGRIKNVSSLVAHTICDHYPMFSYEWLRFGRGEMFTDGTHYEPQPIPEHISPTEVLDCIFAHYGTNASRLAAMTGVNKGTLSMIHKGTGTTRNITEATAMRILRVYPELSHDWLVDGIGPMFADGRVFVAPPAKEELPVTDAKPRDLSRLSLAKQVEELTARLAEMEKRLAGGMVAEDINGEG